MKKFTLKVSGRSFASSFSPQTTRNDTKFHTEYKFSPRLSGWDGQDPDAAPSQIHTIDALFKNVIANLRHLDVSFKDMHTAVEQVPGTCKIKGKLKGLAGKFKHDIQGAKDNAVSAWKLCDTALREARKAKSSAARKDVQASLPSLRKDALAGRSTIAKTYASIYGDDTITALADVEYEAKMILRGAEDAKKLVNQSLSTRLKNKGILEIKGVQAHITAITKLCDSAFKVGNEILRTTQAESGRLKKVKESAASRKDSAIKMQGKKTFVLRKDGVVTRADASAEEFHNRLARGLKKAEDLLNARAAQIWKAEQSKVSHDVSKGKFRIALSARTSAEGKDFELKLQFISSGSHGIPAKTMDSATMGEVVRIIKSSLGASSINASTLRISSGRGGGAPTIGFLTLKGKVAVERGDALKRLDWLECLRS